MIGLNFVFILAGILFAAFAMLNLIDATNPQRFGNAVFWGCYSVTLLFGARLSDFANGCLVLVLLIVGGTSRLGRGEPRTTSGEERRESATRWGNRLFIPALLTPALTLLATVLLKGVTLNGAPLFDPKNLSIISLGLASVVAVVVALVLLRQPLAAPIHEARRMIDMIGWAAILPQLLAALGVLFADLGVGERIAEILRHVVPLDNAFAVVCVYTMGMALFTVIMGNAFAAFPVMTAAIGLPIIVGRLGGDPAVMAAIGMLSGFCGTLMTPMAANFNIVPAVLLELPDRNGVIRVQAPTALVLLVGNTFLMYFLVFHAR
ncbi:MAG TPA: DUF979 domain-containing protein [Polyangiaceae bacterium]|nr:DUF979 domain-containing protein [Polyangiaceae bacterium]